MFIEFNFDRDSPPNGSSFPFESSNLAPNACAIPAPASLVALPPIPIIKSLYPWSSASNITSPKP